MHGDGGGRDLHPHHRRLHRCRRPRRRDQTSATARATASGAAAARTRSRPRWATSSTSAASTWTTARPARSAGSRWLTGGGRLVRDPGAELGADRPPHPSGRPLLRPPLPRSDLGGVRDDRPRAVRRASARARRGHPARRGRHLGRRLPPRPVGRAAAEPPARPVPVGRLERRLQPRPSVGLQAAPGLRPAPAPLLVATRPRRRVTSRGRCACSRYAELRRRLPAHAAARTHRRRSRRAPARGRQARARAGDLAGRERRSRGLGARARGLSADRQGGRGRLHRAARGRQVHADRPARGARAREREREVAVLSIDPSSPFTHGALLGDRIRLTDHFLDPGVFIRSMASRGSLGGLSEATLQAALLMDAAGRTTSSSRPWGWARPRWTSSTTRTRSCSS